MANGEWGIFNDDAADYTAEEAVEAQFYSKEEALAALAERYGGDEGEGLVVHQCEEPEEEEETEDDSHEEFDDEED